MEKVVCVSESVFNDRKVKILAQKIAIPFVLLANLTQFSGCAQTDTKTNNTNTDSELPSSWYEHMDYYSKARIMMEFGCTEQQIIKIKIQPYDTLSSIAYKYDMSIEQLARINGITDPDFIKEGQLITVVDKSIQNSIISKYSIEKIIEEFKCNVEDIVTVVIKTGDTLSEIAEQYGMKLADLIRINGIENPNVINANETLMVIDRKPLQTEEIVSNNSSFSQKISEQGYTKGIDISAVGQSNMDLKSVLEKNDIDFVMLRMAYFIKQSQYDADENGIDDIFDKHAKICAEANIPTGVYFWPSLVDVPSAKREVNIIMNKLKDVKDKYGLCMEMPICIDIELARDGGGQVTTLLSEGNQDSIEALEYIVNTLEENGYYVMIYTGNGALTEKPEYRRLIESLNIEGWISRYYYRSPVKFEDVPYMEDVLFNGEVSMRQYAETGVLKGFNKSVDLNVCYKDFPSIIKELGLNGFTPDRRNSNEQNKELFLSL